MEQSVYGNWDHSREMHTFIVARREDIVFGPDLLGVAMMLATGHPTRECKCSGAPIWYVQDGLSRCNYYAFLTIFKRSQHDQHDGELPLVNHCLGTPELAAAVTSLPQMDLCRDYKIRKCSLSVHVSQPSLSLDITCMQHARRFLLWGGRAIRALTASTKSDA